MIIFPDTSVMFAFVGENCVELRSAYKISPSRTELGSLKKY